MNPEIQCPYCVKPIQECLKSATCPIPFKYGERARQAKPVWAMTAGFPNHGKTVYLAALTLILDRLGDLLPDFVCDYMSHQPTLDAFKAMRAMDKSRVLSRATQQSRPQPLFLELNGLPLRQARSENEQRILVMFDPPGEYFSTVEGQPRNLDILPFISTIWFLVSLKDLQTGKDPVTLSDLFLSYRATLERAGFEVRNRRIIVVYTKADLLNNQLPQSVIDYLLEDPFQGLNQGYQPVLEGFSIEEYLEKAAEVSATLEEFTLKQPGGRQFISLVRRQGLDLRFCAVSATGHNPDEQSNRLLEQATRYRLLDPLFWTLNESGTSPPPDTRSRLTLVLDSPADGDASYASGIPESLWRSMSSRGNTTTHFLGNSRPASIPGQQPAFVASRKLRLPLIGPILDRLGADDKVLILTRNVIPDLADFRNSQWRNRLLLGTHEEEEVDQWQNTVVIRSPDDCESVVTRLVSLEDQ